MTMSALVDDLGLKVLFSEYFFENDTHVRIDSPITMQVQTSLLREQVAPEH